jgi:hypothetical protein
MVSPRNNRGRILKSAGEIPVNCFGINKTPPTNQTERYTSRKKTSEISPQKLVSELTTSQYEVTIE